MPAQHRKLPHMPKYVSSLTLLAYLKLKLPENAPFVLKPSPGKGWGVFATKDLKKGELILREDPLFVIRKPIDKSIDLAVLAGFQRLKPADRQQFLCLRENGSKIYTNMTDAFYGNNMTVSSVVKLKDSEHPARGMFILQPRFNHSCVANCKAPFDGKECISTYAIRDIAAGEELTICYDGSLTFYPAKDRHDALGFVCDCPACLPGTGFQKLSEARRTLLRGLMYLQDGEDINRKKHSPGSSIIMDLKLKKAAEQSRITLANRFIYQLLVLFLLEEEGMLDIYTLKSLRRRLDRTVNLFQEERNARIARLAMRRKTWLRKFLTAFKLYGQEDGADFFASMYFGKKGGTHTVFV
ncbi:hypothetical protein MferCBS49748_002817 [Microsporum ferrugineum]